MRHTGLGNLRSEGSPTGTCQGAKKDSGKTDKENGRSRIREGNTILYLPPRIIASLESCIQDSSRTHGGQFTWLEGLDNRYVQLGIATCVPWSSMEEKLWG